MHKVSQAVLGLLKRVIHFPQQHEMEDVGAGFARLAGSLAFHGAVGATFASRPLQRMLLLLH